MNRLQLPISADYAATFSGMEHTKFRSTSAAVARSVFALPCEEEASFIAAPEDLTTRSSNSFTHSGGFGTGW